MRILWAIGLVFLGELTIQAEGLVVLETKNNSISSFAQDLKNKKMGLWFGSTTTVDLIENALFIAVEEGSEKLSQVAAIAPRFASESGDKFVGPAYCRFETKPEVQGILTLSKGTRVVFERLDDQDVTKVWIRQPSIFVSMRCYPAQITPVSARALTATVPLEVKTRDELRAIFGKDIVLTFTGR